MKMYGKLLLALMAALMLLNLAACSGGGNGGGSADADETEAPASMNELTMGTNAEFPPYEYHEGGAIVGIDAEIAAEIAAKLGMTLKIEDMDFDSIIPAVVTGKVDIGMAGMTVTEERQLEVNFSTSYATGVQVIIVPEGSDITGPDDLDGKIIGVQFNTTGDLYSTWDYGDEFVERYNTGAEAVMALTTDKVDCVIIDNEPAKSFVAENEGLAILDTEYAVEDYAISIAKENTELLEKINTALEELIADGTVQSILDKYIK